MLPCTRQDTIVTGLKVGVLDLSAPGSLPVLIPGTDYASGVAPGASPGEIYYTLGGDTRVYRRVLATGEVSVLYDFGAAGIARDVHAVGNRFTAIVGGHVIFSVDPLFGPVQWDSGGLIHVVDLSTGTDMLVAGPGLFRHPALAPNGDRVVAEVPAQHPGRPRPLRRSSWRGLPLHRAMTSPLASSPPWWSRSCGLALGVVCAGGLSAQSEGTLAGSVRDSTTNGALGGAQVLVDDRIGASPTRRECYRVRAVHSGWHRVSARLIGYRGVVLDSVFVRCRRDGHGGLRARRPARWSWRRWWLRPRSTSCSTPWPPARSRRSRPRTCAAAGELAQ